MLTLQLCVLGENSIHVNLCAKYSFYRHSTSDRSGIIAYRENLNYCIDLFNTYFETINIILLLFCIPFAIFVALLVPSSKSL